MKKMLSIVLVASLALSMLVGCGAKEDSKAPETDNTKVEDTNTKTVEPASKEAASDAEAAAGEIAKIGLGTITSIGKSKDKDGDKGPVGQVDTVIVAAAFDKDGKVVKVDIDNAQTKVEYGADLQVSTDVNSELKTKVELGDEYGMKKASSIGKEWYEQAKALGDWMVGKSVDEIKGMKTTKRDDAHPAVPDEADLTSTVTVTVQDYIAAVEKAYNNAIDVKPGGEKLGVGQSISIKKSKGLNGDKTPVAQVDTTIVVGAFDKDGKVVGTIIDNAQTKVEFDKDGKVTSDKGAELKTKVELGDEYGMKKASSIGKEWYEQAKALGDWMTGKTVDEIKGMKTTQRDDAHPSVPAEADLTSTVTVTVQDYIAGIDEAFTKAQ
ncbi:LptM family lipoprotein [Paenibacillus marinisediminis]